MTNPNADGRSRIAHDLRDAGFTSASWQDGPERQAITLSAGQAAALLLHGRVKLRGGEVQLPPGPEALQANDAALAVILRYGGIDGGHHAWVIDQVVRALTGDGYAEWVRAAQDGEDGPDTYPWDVGTPP